MADLQLQISDLCFLPRARTVACSALSDMLLGVGRDGKGARDCVPGMHSMCCELLHHASKRFCKSRDSEKGKNNVQ